MEQEKKSVVALVWYNTKDASVYYRSTGFIVKKDEIGILILSVSEFIPRLPKAPIPKPEIGVKVCFFDQLTQIDARVLHYDLAVNMVAILIRTCKEFDSHPISCIQATSMSTDPIYQGQSVKAIHHARVFEIHFGYEVEAFNQSTKGFVADINYLDGGQVHFSMPVIFSGSLGAPVFDKHSNRVVSMIQGWESGPREDYDKPIDGKYWSDVHNRYLGRPVPRIEQFLNEVTDAVNNNPPV